RPLPVVSILIPLYVAASVLLHPPGDHLHAHSSPALPNPSAVPNPTLMNQSHSSNAQDLVPPLVAVLLLSKFLHWMTRRHCTLLGALNELVTRRNASRTQNGKWHSSLSDRSSAQRRC
ncbi:hypothetical protein EV702DRAFT_1140141, partial [Suillus placidus]